MKPLSTLQCLHLIVLLAALGAAGFRTMDRLTDPGLDAGAVSAEDRGGNFHDGSRRMFVLVIDSLRYQTAVDPQRMPHLCVMQSAGVHARLQTVRDAVTVPALRAAFTGKDRVSIFGFVKNFWHRHEGFSSLFTQAAEEGLRIGVWCDGSFKQFDKDLTARHFNRQGEGHDMERQDRAVEAALSAYRAGEYDMVIAHITYSDDIAHQVGVHHPKYHAIYRALDSLIHRLDGIVGADETLMVMGDHGHDEIGRHMMGLDVPTFALYRGPGYRPGTDLGTVPIMDTRYLMSWGLKLPLPWNYSAGRHPQALVSSGPPPEAYAREFDTLQVQQLGAGVPAARRLEYFSTMLGLALLVSVWVALARQQSTDAITAVAVWPALAALSYPDVIPLGVPVGLVLAAGILVRLVVRSDRARPAVLWAILPGLGALAFERWGWFLSLVRPTVHEPEYIIIVGAWVAVAAVALVLTMRYGALRAIWLIVLALGALLYPTAYRYGGPGTMAPLWLLCLGLLLVEGLRQRRMEVFKGLAPVALMLSPFLLVDSVHFQFSSWFWPIGPVFFGGPRTEELLIPGLLLAFAAKLVVFSHRDSNAVMKFAALGVALMLQVLQSGLVFQPEAALLSRHWIGSGHGRMAALIHLGLAAALIGTAMVASRSAASSQRRSLVRLGILAALYVVFLYSVRIPRDAYLWLDCLLAAFALSGRWIARHAFEDRHSSLYALLTLLGVVATGWAGLAWTFHRLEWGFLYDWFPSYVLEWNVGWFLGPIVVRYLIPLVMIRLVLAGELGARWEYPHRLLLLLGGLKALSVLVVACGMGYRDVHSDVYLEAVQETAIWGLMFAVLPWSGRRTR